MKKIQVFFKKVLKPYFDDGFWGEKFDFINTSELFRKPKLEYLEVNFNLSKWLN